MRYLLVGGAMRTVPVICCVLLASVSFASAQQPASPPTYADVLRSPNDLNLTILYVDHLIRAGRLNSAAAQLERVLLVQPEADQVRLLYVAVLFRLDDMVGAKREVEVLKRRNLPEGLLDELASYDEAVGQRMDPTRFGATIAVGGRYDSNRNFDPASSDGLLFGVPVDMPGDPEPDAAGVVSASVYGEHDLDSQTFRRIYFSADLGTIEQADLTEYTLSYARIQTGFDVVLGRFNIQTTARVGGYAQEHDLFQREAGGNIRVLTGVSDRLKVFSDFDGVMQWYDETELSPGSEMRTGERLKFGGGFIFDGSDRFQTLFAARFMDKAAEVEQYAYDGLELEARAQYLLPKGQFVAGRVIYANFQFDAPDPVYSPTITREDDYLAAKATYGVPLGTLAGWAGVDLQPFVGRVVFQPSVEYVLQDSNIPNFEYENIGGEILLVQRFAF
jgi:hypothetical protein